MNNEILDIVWIFCACAFFITTSYFSGSIIWIDHFHTFTLSPFAPGYSLCWELTLGFLVWGGIPANFQASPNINHLMDRGLSRQTHSIPAFQFCSFLLEKLEKKVKNLDPSGWNLATPLFSQMHGKNSFSREQEESQQGPIYLSCYHIWSKGIMELGKQSRKLPVPDAITEHNKLIQRTNCVNGIYAAEKITSCEKQQEAISAAEQENAHILRPRSQEKPENKAG